MPKAMYLLTTIACSILIFTGCQVKEQADTGIMPASQGDWPVYSINELTNDSDLIAYVEVKETKNVDGNPPSQESILTVVKTLKGKTTEDTILLSLSESQYYVKTGNKYSMFLSNKGSYYTQRSANALIPERDGKFHSTIKGMTGDYELQDIEDQLNKSIR